ncbi:MAG: SRPBCC family protein [Pseudomonas sp.]|uniref:SRPBCC family protein n=1 Tax=Pseudomonas sp. TaxID=306 RepID=UPI00339724B9
MKRIKVFLAGAAYGLAMRLTFGGLGYLNGPGVDAASGPMLASFVILVPILIGVYTAYTASPQQRTWVYCLFAPWVPMLLFAAGSALLLLEGSICIAMALPIFLLMASLGALACWLLLKVVKPARGTLPALLVLPLLTSVLETRVEQPRLLEQSRASVHIAAPPPVLWGLINDAAQIQPAEMAEGLAYRIGVPYPISAKTVDTPSGKVRKLVWGKGVHFDEPILDWQENRYIRWRYRFSPESFPPNALDEHVVIGGKYFDLLDTSYRLTPEAGGTRLEIVVSYRVSTNFNWYANAWGKLLVDDSAQTILQFYKQRGERQSGLASR